MNNLVIALYNERKSLNSFKKFSKLYNYKPIIYNKGDIKVNDSYFENIQLPNIGLHTHSYLYHILHNYNNLSENTIFMIGSAFRDLKKSRKAEWILNNANKCSGFMAQHIWLSEEEDYYFELPFYEVFDYSNKWIKSNSKRIRTEMIRADRKPLGKWIEFNTNQVFKNKKFYRSSKCMFVVNKKLIHKSPISYWQKLYDKFNFALQNERNLEIIHYFERAWLTIFLRKNSITYLQHDEKKYGPIKPYIN